jgi:LacI family transcriptional regulator
VFAANDSMAVGCLSAFHEAGLRVPEDVALGGFDDIPIACYVSPPLTSVRVPIAELGALAMETLLARFGGGGGPARRTLLPTQLVVRASSGAPGDRIPIAPQPPRPRRLRERK